jgi:hypothetical protein
MITMIGCNKSQFMTIIEKAVGKITMSSGSYYSPYLIFDNNGLLAKYDSDGSLLYNR